MNEDSGAAGERTVVRDLAHKVAAIAHEPRMAAIRRRWSDVNALRRPDRAPVWCRPVGCWPELLPPSSLTCQTPWLRDIELGFRRILCKRELDDDSPVSAYYGVPVVMKADPPNLWGVDIGRKAPKETGGAWAYDPPLKSEADFDRLQPPTFTYDAAGTEERLNRAHDLLGDILPVRRIGGAPLNAGLGTAAADLRGLEQMMLDMITAPELMHRLMAYLRDAVLRGMDTVEQLGILTPNNDGPMTCSDPTAPEPANGRYGFEHCWDISNSQEFDQVSPTMWEEFCLAYQKPILARFDLTGYGCCENLTHKIDGVLTIPNLRIFTCSAWTRLDLVIERVDRNASIMWRQKASDVVFGDEATLRRDLFDGAKRLQGYYYQVVLRELQTLAGDLRRLHKWTQYAKEATETFA